MSSVLRLPVVNRLIQALSARARRAILDPCELVELTLGEVLCEPGDRIRDAYFPTGSLMTLVSVLDNEASIEVALIGNEGMFGVPLVPAIRFSPRGRWRR